MEENKDRDVHNRGKTVENERNVFLRDFIAGICIGVAFIIPGFSGGSVAAILGVYEKLVNAIANIFKEMKKSIITLLPIGLGLVTGAASLLYPIGFMIERFPLPTVSVFVGLAIGGIPSVSAKLKGKIKVYNVIAFSLPFLLAASLSFVPVGADVDLFGIGLGGYLLLFLVGMLGSSALVVPGISGSMLLLILGYYNPILKLVTEHLLRFEDIGDCILILGACGIGVAVGFFLISLLMKHLLVKYPRGTYFAIIGFIVGSLPTVYVSTMKSVDMLTPSLEIIEIPSSPWHYVICLCLVLIGVAVTYGFSRLAAKKAD